MSLSSVDDMSVFVSPFSAIFRALVSDSIDCLQ